MFRHISRPVKAQPWKLNTDTKRSDSRDLNDPNVSYFVIDFLMIFSCVIIFIMFRICVRICPLPDAGAAADVSVEK